MAGRRQFLLPNGSHRLAFDIDAVNVRLDEARPPQGGADRLSAMPQFQPARAGFEQKRRKDEEVLAADERDLEVAPRAQPPFEVPRGCDATKSSTEDDNTHCLSPSCGEAIEPL